MGTTGQSITLANSIIGVGILAMPFCFQQCGVLLATLILLSMGLMSRLCCYFLLKSAIITRRRNYEFLAFHVFGPAGKIAVETGIIGFLMGTCIAYFVVVGDLGPQIIAKLLNINQSDILRTSIMVIVSLVCVLPLGLLRNVDSLSNVSAATIAFYFCLVIKVITEATSQLLASDWHTRVEMWRPAGVLQCVPIFSMALFCQTQLFEIFESMPSLSLEKMCVVTKNAINICAAVYFTLGLFGYIAFGSHEISGNILMSLSPTWASDVIKLGFVMSLAFSFPLIIFPCRASLYSFLYRKAHPAHHDHIINHSIPEGTFRCITVGIVGAALFVSLMLPNIELVLGLLGATIGVLVCVVFPAACFVNVTFKDTNERVLAKFVVVLGFIILVLGTYANLEAAENTRDKYDDRQITKERIDKIVEDFFHKMENSEAAIVRPNLENGSGPKKDSMIEHEIMKDYEVQPPNPVPPESQSNEKKPVLKVLDDNKLKTPEKIIPKIDHTLNKVSESHPKDVISKLNGQSVVNGDTKQMVPAESSENNNMEKLKEEKLVNSQEKIAIMKQQQLMETIKQHGKEQKELIKEQKEILDEILKTKKEMEIKKEVESNEAKKIAVESIQKIANIAIQSIGGVTDKPVDLNKAGQPEPIANIANEAVHEIAKKAAETLNAIKKIEEPSSLVKKQDVSNGVEKVDVDRNPQSSNIELQGQLNVKNEQNLDSGNPQQLINANVKQAPLELENAKDLLTNRNNQQDKPPSVVLNEMPNNNPVVQAQVNGIGIQKADTNKVLNNGIEEKHPNEHQENIINKPDKIEKEEANLINQNNEKDKPLPVLLKDKEILDNVKNTIEFQPEIKINNNLEQKDLKNEIDNRIDDGKKNNIVPVRQKREVVDCTEKTLLKPEDKQICENLVNRPIEKETSELLPKVNLGDVGLAKIPLQVLSIHHMRSFKSYENDRDTNLM